MEIPERDKLRRKPMALSKSKRKILTRVHSGTPPRSIEPFSSRERRRLLAALRECAQAVDAAGPGGSLPDRAKMEGLLRCLTHSISLLELDICVEKGHSSNSYETDVRQSSSCDSSLLCRGPNLHSALTPINFVKSRRTSSTHHARSNIKVIDHSSSSTVCLLHDTNEETTSQEARRNENYDAADGDESSNADESCSTLVGSAKTVVHVEKYQRDNLIVGEKEDFHPDFSGNFGRWLSSYPPTPFMSSRGSYCNSAHHYNTAVDTEEIENSQDSITNLQKTLSVVTLNGRTKPLGEGKEKRGQSKSESPKLSSGKKDDPVLKVSRKSSPNEKNLPTGKKLVREKSLYTVRSGKRDSGGSPRKRVLAREGDHQKNRSREKDGFSHGKSSVRDALKLKPGSPELKLERASEICSPKLSNSASQKSLLSRPTSRKIKPHESFGSKRSLRKIPASRISMSGCSSSIPSSVNVDFPIYQSANLPTIGDDVNDGTPKAGLNAGKKEDTLKLNNSNVREPDDDEKSESSAKKRNTRRGQKSRKSKREKPKSQPSSAKTNSIPNNIPKTSSESRFVSSNKRAHKVSADPFSQTMTTGLLPRATYSDRKIDKKLENSKRTTYLEKPSSGASERVDRPQTSGARRTHRRNSSGHLNNKIGLMYSSHPSKRIHRNHTRNSARSVKSREDGSPLTYSPKSSANAEKPRATKSKNNTWTSDSSSPTRTSPRSSVNVVLQRTEGKKIIPRSPVSKGGLVKSASAHPVPREKNKSPISAKQFNGVLPKCISYPENILEGLKTTPLTCAMANDFRKIRKARASWSKESKSIQPPEKYSTVDLRKLLTQSAIKKKRVSFACFDELQPSNVRRLKTETAELPQNNAKTNCSQKKTMLSPQLNKLIINSPTDVKRPNTTNKTKLNDHGDVVKESIRIPSVTKAINSILISAKGGLAKCEVNALRQIPDNGTNRGTSSQDNQLKNSHPAVPQSSDFLSSASTVRSQLTVEEHCPKLGRKSSYHNPNQRPYAITAASYNNHSNLWSTPQETDSGLPNQG